MEEPSVLALGKVKVEGGDPATNVRKNSGWRYTYSIQTVLNMQWWSLEWEGHIEQSLLHPSQQLKKKTATSQDKDELKALLDLPIVPPTSKKKTLVKVWNLNTI